MEAEQRLQFVVYCHKALLANSKVLEYLIDSRHVSMNSIKEFMLGFCPVDMRPSQYDLMGFCTLKGRIIVPIFSEFGKIVGIAGRVPDAKIKGWWNTKFEKSSHLYGFHNARKHIFQTNKVYIVEGYFDHIILAQNGLPNSVAIMSSSLGMRRVGLLARYCDQVCLCFDTDQNHAGKLGMLKTLNEFQTVGFGNDPYNPSGYKNLCHNISMITLPVGIDPDDYVYRNGLKAFLALEKPFSVKQMVMAGKAYDELKEIIRRTKRKGHNV
jgi:DNA primase